MSSRRAAVPDAWDDDWEASADKAAPKPPTPPPAPKPSRAERKARHEEENRRLWTEAETSKDDDDNMMFHRLRESNIPLRSDIKPALQVLRRKPPSSKDAATTSDPSSTATALMSKVSLQTRPSGATPSPTTQPVNNDDEGSSDEEDRKARARELAERQVRVLREREEKQRRYAETRSRLFGPDDASGATPSSPGTSSSRGRGTADGPRGRGRGRGRGRAYNSSSPSFTEANDPTAEAGAGERRLFDPDEPSPSRAGAPRRSPLLSGGGGGAEEALRSREASQVIRAPRGPPAKSGERGFGFGGRGRGMPSRGEGGGA